MPKTALIRHTAEYRTYLLARVDAKEGKVKKARALNELSQLVEKSENNKVKARAY